MKKNRPTVASLQTDAEELERRQAALLQLARNLGHQRATVVCAYAGQGRPPAGAKVVLSPRRDH